MSASEAPNATQSKLKTQNTVLRKAYLNEKKKTGDLEKAVKEKDSHIQKLLQEIDDLNFNNQRLTKRCGKLVQKVKAGEDTEIGRYVDIFGEVLTSRNSWSSKWFGAKADSEDGGKHVQLIQNELSVKIKENESLHMQLFESSNEHTKTLLMLEKKLADLKENLQGKETRLSERSEECKTLHSQIEEASAAHAEEIREIQEKLDASSARARLREKELLAINKKLETELFSIEERLKSQIPFQDTENISLNTLNVATFDREFILRKQHLCETLCGVMSNFTRKITSILDAFAAKLSHQLVEHQNRQLEPLRELHAAASVKLDKHNELRTVLHDDCCSIGLALKHMVESLQWEAEHGYMAYFEDHCEKIDFRAMKDTGDLFLAVHSIIEHLDQWLSLQREDVEDEIQCSQSGKKMQLERLADAVLELQSHLCTGLLDLGNFVDTFHASGESINSVSLTALFEHIPYESVHSALTQLKMDCTTLSSRFAALLAPRSAGSADSSEDAVSISQTKELRESNSQMVKDVSAISNLLSRVDSAFSGFQVVLMERKARSSGVSTSSPPLLKKFHSKAQKFIHQLSEVSTASSISYWTALHQSENVIPRLLRRQQEDSESISRMSATINEQTEEISVLNTHISEFSEVIEGLRRDLGASESNSMQLAELLTSLRAEHSEENAEPFDFDCRYISEEISRHISPTPEVRVVSAVKTNDEESVATSVPPARSISPAELCRSVNDDSSMTLSDFIQTLDLVGGTGDREELENQILLLSERGLKLQRDMLAVCKRYQEIFQQSCVEKSLLNVAQSEVNRLKDEISITRRNYDTMIAEMTEHICRLTERIAVLDAKKSY